jgi:co-chaperonin GroES (HSP10)
MQSLYQFIIEPIGERYNNKIKVDKKELIINSSISDHKFINRTAKVIEVPKALNTPIKKGDKVIVHHNLFRRYYDLKGKSVNSSKFFKDNMFFAEVSQVYLYNNNDKWHTTNDYCFIKPILEKTSFKKSKLKKNTGIVKYDNSSLEALEITPGDVVGFKPNREFQFIIDGELLYCMESNDIVIKYEHERNKTEYNPSWAKSS